MPDLPDLSVLTTWLHSPLLQQGLVLLAALAGGLLVLTVVARLEVTPMSSAGRALAEAVHTGLAQRSAKRVPGTVRVQIDPLRVG